MESQAETVGLSEGTKGSKVKGARVDEKPTLAEAGIDKNLAHRARILRTKSDAEFEEFIRKNFSPSEAVSVKWAIEPNIREAAQERMLAGEPCENFSQGKSRESVAELTGYSFGTLDKAEQVVQAAETDPEKFGRFVEKMDRTGNVHGAFKELRKEQANIERSKTRPGSLAFGRRVLALLIP
jgi:hypothetical protein